MPHQRQDELERQRLSHSNQFLRGMGRYFPDFLPPPDTCPASDCWIPVPPRYTITRIRPPQQDPRLRPRVVQTLAQPSPIRGWQQLEFNFGKLAVDEELEEYWMEKLLRFCQ